MIFVRRVFLWKFRQTFRPNSLMQEVNENLIVRNKKKIISKFNTITIHAFTQKRNKTYIIKFYDPKFISRVPPKTVQEY